MTGRADTASGTSRAFFCSGGAMTDLNAVNGVAGSGWTLSEGRGINDVGQLTGGGVNPAGQFRAFVLTLDTTVWEYGYSAAWDDTAGWSHQIAPKRNTAVIIDPVRSLTVTGPGGAVSVKGLIVGTDASGGGGIATLRLDGGTVSTVGDAWPRATWWSAETAC